MADSGLFRSRASSVAANGNGREGMDSQSGMGLEAAEKGSTTIVYGRIELRPRRSANGVSLENGKAKQE